MHYRTLSSLLLGAVAATLATSAIAAENERRYDVEIVIVENTDTAAGEQERWQPRVTVPDIEGAIAFEPRSHLPPMTRREQLAATPKGFESLPPERLKLGGAIEKLEESEHYRVLRHLAWRQPAYDQEKSLPVRVYFGKPITVRVPITDFEDLYALEETGDEGTGDRAAADSEDTTTTTSTDTFASGTADDAGTARTFGAGPMFQSRYRPLLRPVEIHPLDGTIRVVVSRYLHVYTNLYFTTSVQWTALPGEQGNTSDSAADNGDTAEEGDESGRNTPTGGAEMPRFALGPDGNTMLSYPFVQHRRMRSGELHYLDNPVLGMLIRVDRAPEEDTEDGEEATQS